MQLVDRVDAEHDDHAGDRADDRRRPDLDVAGGGGDRHQRRDRAVAGHADVDRPGLEPAVATAASTPAAAARLVMNRISAKRPSSAFRVEPGLNPNQPSHRIRTPSPKSGMLCPGIARGLPSRPYLPFRGAEQQQGREGAAGADQVDGRGAGEVLHPDDRGAQPVAVLQEAAAEHPVGADRVDDRSRRSPSR